MPMTDYTLPRTRPEHDTDITERQLLQLTVEIGKYVFGSAAASVFLLDSDTGDLIFEAVAGHGEGTLPGTRLQAGTGIAGLVAASGQPMLIDDLSDSTAFDGATAKATGFVPRSMMAAPLIRDGDCIGVLEVLDPDPKVRNSTLTDLELLSLLSTHAATALDLLVRVRAREPNGALSADQEDLLGRIATRLRSASPDVANIAVKLLSSADELLHGSLSAR